MGSSTVHLTIYWPNPYPLPEDVQTAIEACDFDDIMERDDSLPSRTDIVEVSVWEARYGDEKFLASDGDYRPLIDALQQHLVPWYLYDCGDGVEWGPQWTCWDHKRGLRRGYGGAQGDHMVPIDDLKAADDLQELIEQNDYPGPHLREVARTVATASDTIIATIKQALTKEKQ